MGRPRLPASQLSRWAIYKRHQRSYGPARGTVLHHRDGNPRNNSPANLVRILRSRHAAVHNRLRRIRSRA